MTSTTTAIPHNKSSSLNWTTAAPAIKLFALGTICGACLAYLATATQMEATLTQQASDNRVLRWQINSINNLLKAAQQTATTKEQIIEQTQQQLNDAQQQLAELTAAQDLRKTKPAAPAAAPAPIRRQPIKETWLTSPKPAGITNIRLANEPPPPIKAQQVTTKAAPLPATPSAPASPQPQQQITAEPPSAGPANLPRISAPTSALKISTLDPRGIILPNGSMIAIGQKFPSGEKLISVDTAHKQITTDQRIITVTSP